jgi:UDP-GlcNAc:undecaprenyl-phosphate GlcNAc-1-phosphate transferase
MDGGLHQRYEFAHNRDGLFGRRGGGGGGLFLAAGSVSGQYLVGILAAALQGACVGFLVYNINPAHCIFMGDGWRLFLGFVLAAVASNCAFPITSIL